MCWYLADEIQTKFSQKFVLTIFRRFFLLISKFNFNEELVYLNEKSVDIHIGTVIDK